MNNDELKGQHGPKEQSNAGQNNRVTVSVRYQETVVPVEVNIHESVEALLQAAINATENQSTSKDRFQLKLEGTVLNPHKKVEDYPLQNGSMLVLVLIAGGGGNY